MVTEVEQRDPGRTVLTALAALIALTAVTAVTALAVLMVRQQAVLARRRMRQRAVVQMRMVEQAVPGPVMTQSVTAELAIDPLTML
ncbi:hypothetical protein D3C77_597030 [compost metagenome]